MFSFVILTWNSSKTINDCLLSISKNSIKSRLNYEMLIVDNGSNDQTVKMIRDNFKYLPVKLTVLPKNMGTTFSRNIALRQAKGDIICVIDSDAVLQQGDLNEIANRLKDDSLGIVAPKLVLPDGTVQNSVKKFPSLLAKLAKILKIIFNIKIGDYDWYQDFPFSGETEVDYAISACWFFKRRLLQEVGFLDEKIFYAPEDIDYCLRVRRKGKQIIYYPYLTVLHHCQQITHKYALSMISLSHFWGLLYYFAKHRYLIKPKI